MAFGEKGNRNRKPLHQVKCDSDHVGNKRAQFHKDAGSQFEFEFHSIQYSSFLQISQECLHLLHMNVQFT